MCLKFGDDADDLADADDHGEQDQAEPAENNPESAAPNSRRLALVRQFM